MYSREICINSIEHVKKLTNITFKYNEDIDLVSGKYIVDAKSIMGIFSLDLSKFVNIIIHTDDEQRANEFFNELTNSGIRVIHMFTMRDSKINNNDNFWVSLDLIDPYTEIIIGEHYCINEDNKFELFEKQPIYNNQLYILINATFKDNTRRQWYEFLKPKKIINGYTFQCIDLEESNEV